MPMLLDEVRSNNDGDMDKSTSVIIAVESEPESGFSQTVPSPHTNHCKEEEVSKMNCYSVPEASASTSKSWTETLRARLDKALLPRTPLQWVGVFLPCYNWLRLYDWRKMLLSDCLAGLAVGVMVIPQSLSYAKLADLPVEYGLYSALFPLWAYSLFGSSPQLSIGPVAPISLLLATGLNNQMMQMGITTNDTNYMSVRTTLAIQTCLLVGLFNLAMGIFRLGFITIFLSPAVISGFLSGASIIVAMSQVKNILGINSNGDNVQRMLASIFGDLQNFNVNSFLMGMSSIIALLFFKHLAKMYPKQKWLRAIGPLFVTLVTVLITWGFNLSSLLPIVKTIPSGFPAVTVDRWSPIADFGRLALTAISITIIAFMQSFSVAKSLAKKHKYELDSSTELIGLGMANFVGSMFQAFPVTGSLSRSAVNDQCGALSGISGVITAGLVGVTLLFLTDVFEYLPLSVLGAIVVVGVISLFDYPEAIHLWKVHKLDWMIWMVAFLGTTLLGVELGLFISVAASLMVHLLKSAFPHTAVLGRLPGTMTYNNIKQYPFAEQFDGIVIVRVDGPIYFANSDHIRNKVVKYETAAAEELNAAANKSDNVKFVLVDLSSVFDMDSAGIYNLKEMIESYKERGISILISNPSLSVMKAFARSKLLDTIGLDHVFVSTHEAVIWALDRMREDVGATSDSASIGNSPVDQLKFENIVKDLDV